MSTAATALQDRLTALLITKFGVDPSTVTPKSTFDDLGVDSLVIVEFALLLKKEFGVLVADGELKASATLHDAAVLLAGKGVVV